MRIKTSKSIISNNKDKKNITYNGVINYQKASSSYRRPVNLKFAFAPSYIIYLR
jgi:hypothetical protein